MTAKSMKAFVSAWKKLFGEDGVIFFLGVKDPVFTFWKRVKEGLFPETSSVIVFIGTTVAEDRNDFMDLSMAYPCIWVGNIAIVKYDGNRNPAVRPSQRGLFYQG